MSRGGTFLILLLAAVLVGCDRTAEGRAAYEEGRFTDALDAFDKAIAEAGDDVPPVLYYDQALAALAAGDPARAEEAAQRALEQADAEIAALCHFVRGNTAYARSLVAEEEAKKPGADPRAYQWAIAETEDALAAWRMAASARADWPAARRNVERALLRLEQLRERKKTGGKPKPKPGDGKKPPDDPPKPKPPPKDKRQEPDTAVAKGELPANEVLGLLELLREKESQKRASRRAARRARAAEVERDW
ncbi:MAG: hypothetical protein QNJ98_10945 [Planctomycetota bacterium]|nr:hypothetical protein [Planctomycetota bacterium]